jgi:hypothetical protein
MTAVQVRDSHPLRHPVPRNLKTAPSSNVPLQITSRVPKAPDFKFELLPLHSQLLRQSLLVSFPPLIDMLKFSGYPYLIRGQTEIIIGGCWAERCTLTRREAFTLQRQGTCSNPPFNFRGENFLTVLVPQRQADKPECVFNDARTGMPRGMPRGAMCVQRFDDSLNSAIHTTYRISLRSSSMREPRDPLLKVLIFLSNQFRQTRFINREVGGFPAVRSRLPDRDSKIGKGLCL